MKKRILSIVLVLCMVCALLPAGAMAYNGGTSFNVTWSYDDGVMTISCNGGIRNCLSVTPAWVEYRSPTRILTFCEGVTSIGEVSFKEFRNLRVINIPSSVKTIYPGAFFNCINIKHIYYAGSQSQWNEIRIEYDNNCLARADIHFNSLPHEHSYSAKVIAPTCTQNGYTEYTCSCDDTYTNYFVDALGHSFIEGVCTRCGEADPNYVPPHIHSYTSAVTAPTCTEKGYTTYTCSCGESYKDDYTAALGHSFNGSKCTRCGAANPDYKPIVLVDIADLSSSFKTSIRWAVENEITTGYADSTFKPNATCTRGHVVTFLWRAAGSPEPQSLVNRFTDVDSSSPFYKAILWAAEKGITTGYADGTFRPNDYCTRAHVVTFLWRCEGKPSASGKVKLNDISGLNADFTSAIKWAATNGITTGYSDGTFRPYAVCTRAHVVTFLYRDIT